MTAVSVVSTYRRKETGSKQQVQYTSLFVHSLPRDYVLRTQYHTGQEAECQESETEGLLTTLNYGNLGREESLASSCEFKDSQEAACFHVPGNGMVYIFNRELYKRFKVLWLFNVYKMELLH